MKRFKLILLITITLTALSCSEDSTRLELQDSQFELLEKIQIYDSTDEVSSLFFNAGISKLDVKRKTNYLSLNPLVIVV